MALRVIEIVTPRSDKEEVKQSLEEQQPGMGYVFWASPLDDEDSLSFRVILDVNQTENILDKLAKEGDGQNTEAGEKKEKDKRGRISREELYADVLDMTLLSRNQLIEKQRCPLYDRSTIVRAKRQAVFPQQGILNEALHTELLRRTPSDSCLRDHGRTARPGRLHVFDAFHSPGEERDPQPADL